MTIIIEETKMEFSDSTCEILKQRLASKNYIDSFSQIGNSLILKGYLSTKDKALIAYECLSFNIDFLAGIVGMSEENIQDNWNTTIGRTVNMLGHMIDIDMKKGEYDKALKKIKLLTIKLNEFKKETLEREVEPSIEKPKTIN